jgi:hypothetical protein
VRRSFVAAVATLGLIGALPASGGAATIAGVTAQAAKSCPSRDVKGSIGGQQKCLGRGEFCAQRYKSQYRRYGFTCKLQNGRYRLS